MKLAQVLVMALIASLVVSAYAGDGTLRFGRVQEDCNKLEADSVSATDSEGKETSVITEVDPACEDEAYAEYYPEECNDEEPMSAKRDVATCGKDMCAPLTPGRSFITLNLKGESFITLSAMFDYKGMPFTNARKINSVCGIYIQGQQVAGLANVVQKGFGYSGGAPIQIGCANTLFAYIDNVGINDPNGQGHIPTSADRCE